MNNTSYILERYIKIALNNFKQVIPHGRNYQFRCNVCGDGTGKNNMRGHIRYNEKGQFFYYKCFNFGCKAQIKTWGADKWLKHTSVELHSQYVREILEPNNEHKNKKKVEDIKIIRKVKKKKENTGKIIPITTHNDNKLMKIAVDYCIGRHIHRDIWKSWFVSIEGKYKDRLIIPFYDQNKEIYYYQARALTNKQPKYLNRESGKDNAIYNYYHINKTKVVTIFEGIIDSLFVENSIAIIGLSISEQVQEKINKLNVRYILDNDEPGNDSSKKLLQEGKCIFLWKDFLKDYNLDENIKDMNEAILKLSKINKFEINELDKYFTDSYYDLIKL